MSERIATKEQMSELLSLRTVFSTRLDGKQVRHYRTLADFPGFGHQFRKAVIVENMSNPHHPKAAKAPKPANEQVKRSARVRTYDNPTELGSTNPRFNDPSGNAFKAKRIAARTDKKGRPILPDINAYRFDCPDIDPEWELVNQRRFDETTQHVIASHLYRTKDYPLSGPATALQPCDATGPYTVPTYTIPVAKPSVLFTAVNLSDWDNGGCSDRSLPRVLPLPANPVTAQTPAPWNHPTPKALPVITVAKHDDTGELTGIDVLPWNSVTRKRLFEKTRYKAASRTAAVNPKARAACYRYIPKIPNSTVYAHLAA
jgi:hypothetical protein